MELIVCPILSKQDAQALKDASTEEFDKILSESLMKEFELENDIKAMLQVNSLDIPLYVDMEICKPSWATKKDFIYSKPKGVEDYIDWDF